MQFLQVGVWKECKNLTCKWNNFAFIYIVASEVFPYIVKNKSNVFYYFFVGNKKYIQTVNTYIEENSTYTEKCHRELVFN